MVLYYIKWFDCNAGNDEYGDINKVEFFRKEADAIQRKFDIKKIHEEEEDVYPPKNIFKIEFGGINQLVEELNKINFVIDATSKTNT